MNKLALLFVCLAAISLKGCCSKEDVGADPNRILVENFDNTGRVYVPSSPFGATWAK
jgi:hypothetical protein